MRFHFRGKKKKDWRSELPRNAGGNYRHAHFRNLHLIENRKEFRKWISEKCASKIEKNSVITLSDKEIQEKIEQLTSLLSSNVLSSFPDKEKKIREKVEQLKEEQELRLDKEMQEKIERPRSLLSRNACSSLPDNGEKTRVHVRQLEEEQERRHKQPVRVLSEAHSEAALETNTPVRNYQKLASLFGKDRALEDEVETPREVGQTLAQLNQQVADKAPMNKENSLENDGAVQGTGSNKKQKTKKMKDNDVVILMESFKSVVEAIKDSTAQLAKSNQRLQIPENEVWSHLEELQLHKDVMYDAYL